MTQHTNYLLGDAGDMANWGDPTLLKGGKWAPLELVVAPKFRANFMFLGTVNAAIGDARVVVYLYKHDLTREYVNVDATGKLYEWVLKDCYRELPIEEARDRLVSGLMHAIDEGVDVSLDMKAAYQRLADLCRPERHATNSSPPSSDFP